MNRAIKYVAGTMLAVGAFLPAAGALATSAYAHGVHSWAPAQNDPGKTAVKDTNEDQWVKNEYNRSSTGTQKYTLWNKSDAGTTVYSGDGSTVTKIHACEEYDLAPDICSSWITV
ncbi:hypothetical protein [Actinocorallia longicatena]|uniref:Secreted protein n=1 Tax=Actinocorallia longicatena TaxID=111803 RepID=A0ABP6Q1A7_9ACTN